MKKSSSPSFHFSMYLFTTIVALVYAAQNLISPALITISNYFGFGGEKRQLGELTFSFMILSGISMIIFGYLADKLTRVRILIIGTIIYSIPLTFVALVPSSNAGFSLFFLLQMISGFGFGAVIPNIFSLLGDIIPRNDRSKGFSFFSISSLIGMAFGIGLSTAYIDTDWRLSYFIIGIVSLTCVIFLFFLKEPSRIGMDNSFLIDKGAVEYTYRIKISDLKSIFKKKSNIWLIVNFVDTIPTGIILFLLFAYLDEVHGIPENIGLVFLIFVLLSTLFGTVIFGYITDNLYSKGKRKARVLYALMANIAPIPFVFIGLLIPFQFPKNGTILDLIMVPGALTMLFLFIIGLFLNGATNGSWYATVVDINLPEHRGTVLSTANFFDIIGKSL
ncbi:MAG: MFS transporter, partial [Promethearchaeota archaeon]